MDAMRSWASGFEPFIRAHSAGPGKRCCTDRKQMI